MTPFTTVILASLGLCIVGGILFLSFEGKGDDLISGLSAVVFWLSTIVLLISTVVVGVNAIKREQCKQQAEGLAIDYRHGYAAGCRVEVDGRFIPLDDYRLTRLEDS